MGTGVADGTTVVGVAAGLGVEPVHPAGLDRQKVKTTKQASRCDPRMVSLLLLPGGESARGAFIFPTVYYCI